MHQRQCGHMLLCTTFETLRKHLNLEYCLGIVADALGRREFFTIGSERAAANNVKCLFVGAGERCADDRTGRGNQAEILSPRIQYLHAWC